MGLGRAGAGRAQLQVRKVSPLRREGLETARGRVCNWDSKSRQMLNPHALAPSKPDPRPFLIPNGDFYFGTQLPKDVGYAARLSCMGRW